jgi:two-component system sensor kinase FixL
MANSSGQSQHGVDATGAVPDQHVLQDRMMQVSRLATMGEMAAGIAHEINQPLTAIANYAKACEYFLALSDPDLDEVRMALQEINSEALRAGDIIRRLRRLVSRQEETRSSATIDDIIDEVRPIIVADARMHQARVSFKLHGGLPKLSVDRVQVQHALINLLRNSFEALQENPSDEREVTIETHLTENGEVEIDVRDNGPGVPPSIRDRLFEPFLTTKPAGSGLGLSICRTIAEAHAGTLDYHDGHPQGALFRMHLPVPMEGD